HYLNFSLFQISQTDSFITTPAGKAPAIVSGLQDIQTSLRSLLGLPAVNGTTPGGVIYQSRAGGFSIDELKEDILEWLKLYNQAVNAQDDKVAGWIGGLVTDLKTFLLTVNPETKLDGFINPIVTTSISTLVAPLAKPPSLQPVNGTRLLRNAHNEFSRKSTVALQMLGTLNSAAQPTLLTAVSNASVTAGAPLQNLYAMRMKASPFGSNAPKQAIPQYNTIGQVVGNYYQEWPLLDTFPLIVNVPDFATGDTTITVTVLLQQGLQTPSITIIVPINGTSVSGSFLNLPDVPTITIVVTSTGGTVQNMTFTIADLTIVATPTITSGLIQSWSVQLEETLSVSNGQTATFTNPEETTITYENANLSIANTCMVHLKDADLTILDLDARYDQIVPSSQVVIEYGDSSSIPPLITRVMGVQSLSRADYGISGKITRLTLDQKWLTGNETLLSDIRNITIYAQSDELKPADEPLIDDIQGDTIELDNFYDGLKSGQWAVVSGERTDIINTGGVVTSELAMIASVEQEVRQTNTPPPASSSSSKPAVLPPPQNDLPNDTTHTFLHFASPLSYTYKRATVAVNANVVKATQGETRMEVLGSGDGSKALQQFTLKQSPLTYVSASTPAGAASTLQVFVNDVQWHEVESLDAQGPKAHVFITKTDDTDKTTLTFGSGQQHGARPPTGVENIKALYRTGIGKPGNVDAGQISLLATRPLGVKGVINPKPATGGADRESISQARSNVPLATEALSRIVSVQDYADFARTFAGIGKANALTLPTINRQLVHLTIAGLDNIPIDATSDLYQNLFLALRTSGNPSEPLQVDVCETKLLVLSLRVRILPDYRLETVSPAIRAALLNAFSFEQRDLGQPVYESEVFSVVQQVPGVAFVDLDILDAVDQPKLLNALDVIHQQELQAAVNGVQPNETQDLVKLLNLQVRQVVTSFLARTVRNQPGVILPAQLVFLSPDVPDTLIINELTSTHVALKSKKRR
ncbi:MAG: putative baseplate assembly protein, partial [Ktedonobacteraceae bacterium]